MKTWLIEVLQGRALSEQAASQAMDTIMDGEATPAQIGALLGAMAVRGETEDEIVGFARAMRARGVRVKAPHAVDTCGTGGDGAGTFNISTVASLLVAACGVPVAKHGNRSASGRCGSADVLEALGVRVDGPPANAQRSIDEAGWGFLFAPSFHASTRHAAVPRRELGVRTVFNLLGPLTNPALPVAQVVGVPRPELAPVMARCLQRLGVSRAWVVHGGGIDELSLSAPTTVVALHAGRLHGFTVEPSHAGLGSADRDALGGGDADTNASIARDILEGRPGPPRDVVLLNAAAALVVAGAAGDLREGVVGARHALDSGAAMSVLQRVREISRS